MHFYTSLIYFIRNSSTKTTPEACEKGSLERLLCLF